MKKIAENVMKTIGILLGGTMVGAALLVVAFLMPVNQTNKSTTYDIIEKEGWYPAIPIVSASLDTYFHSYLPGVLDGSTDSIMLETALEPQEKNVLRAAMDMNDYDYYWHGYVSILRPLLMLFDYGEIRTLNGFLQLLLILILFLQVYRTKGMAYGLLVPTSYFLLMSLAMPFSLQYSWVFYIAVGGALVLTRESDDEWYGMKLYHFFMVLGMCTSFFDLLTYPLYTWGFPLIWLLLFKKDDKNAFYYVKEVIFTGLWWILGYGGLWIAKWGLGSLILGHNIFARALYEVGFRLGAEETGGFDFIERLGVLYSNWKHYEYKIYVLVLAVWLAYVVIGTIRNGVRTQVKNKALALVACSGIVWYMALANHTGGHHFFTYRIYGVSVLAVLAILVGSVGEKDSQKAEKYERERERCKLLIIWCVCGILACGLSLLAREDIEVTNGDKAYQQVLVAAEESGKMRFTPAFPTIKEISICAQTASQNGVCSIQVLDGDIILYQEEIALSAYADQTYAAIPVEWKLDRGRDYEMEIRFVGADEECFLLVSENMDAPIGEYGELAVEGVSRGGQILSGISYSYRPLSKFTLAFLAMTWCGILFAGTVACRSVKED